MKTINNQPAAFLVQGIPIFEQAFVETSAGKGEVALSVSGIAIKKTMPRYKIMI